MQISEKWRFVFFWAVLFWGLPMGVVTVLFDWHKTHHLDTPIRILGHIVVYIVCGIPAGLYLWSRRGKLVPRKMTRAHTAGQMVLFIGLMLGLLFVLFRYL